MTSNRKITILLSFQQKKATDEWDEHGSGADKKLEESLSVVWNYVASGGAKWGDDFVRTELFPVARFLDIQPFRPRSLQTRLLVGQRVDTIARPVTVEERIATRAPSRVRAASRGDAESWERPDAGPRGMDRSRSNRAITPFDGARFSHRRVKYMPDRQAAYLLDILNPAKMR